MSLETLLEAAQYIEVETDEDGRTRVRPAQHIPGGLHQYTQLKPDGTIPTGAILVPHSPPTRPSASPQNSGRTDSEKTRSAIGSGTRDLHNKLEKNRRAHLKECFDQLHRQLPNFYDLKASNLSILRNAVRTIQQLQRKEKELEMEMQRLAREKIMSQERISILKLELAAMNIQYDLSHFIEAEQQRDNHSTSTATADEEVPAERYVSDDDNNSSSTLSTTSPNTSGLRLPVTCAGSGSPLKSPHALTATDAMYPQHDHAIRQAVHAPVVTVTEVLIPQTSVPAPANTPAKYSNPLANYTNKPIAQLLQQAIYQRQEHMAQQKAQQQSRLSEMLSAPPIKVEQAVSRQQPRLDELLKAPPLKREFTQNFVMSSQQMPAPSTSGSLKRSRSRPQGSASTSKAAQSTNHLVTIQPLLQPVNKPQTTTLTQPQPAVNISQAPTVTLNQLLPSRYPTVVNPVDLNTLLRLTGVAETKPTTPQVTGNVVTSSVQLPVQQAASVISGGNTTPNALTNLQQAMIANALLQSSQANLVKQENAAAVNNATTTAQASAPAAAIPTPLQTANLASALLGTAVNPPQANNAGQAGNMPVQLVTAQQLQQMILQLQLQQQLQQHLTQQLVQLQNSQQQNANKTVVSNTLTSQPLLTSTSVTSATPNVTDQSQVPTSAVTTPITMPTLPLNQLLQPINDLSAAINPAVQFAPAAASQLPASLQQSLATAQLNQMLAQPQVLKTLGQLPLLQQPTLTVPIMVTMPSVLPTAQNNTIVSTEAPNVKKEG